MPGFATQITDQRQPLVSRIAPSRRAQRAVAAWQAGRSAGRPEPPTAAGRPRLPGSTAHHENAIIACDLQHTCLRAGKSMGRDSLVELLRAIQQVQSQYIEDSEPRQVFDALLDSLLSLTRSEYGFIGEVLHARTGRPYLRTQAITNVAWNDDTRRFYEESAPTGLEFHNLKTLFGSVITSNGPVISNDPEQDPRSGGLPRGHPNLRAFLGLPLIVGNRMVGMLGLANRPGGYDQGLIAYLDPLVATCAGIVHAYRNARERRRADEASRAAEEQMRHVQKLESLGVLAGGIAHDFNNLLAGILGNAELAMLELDASLPAHELIREIHWSAARAAELTHQLLAYTGKAVASVDTFDVSELVSEMSTLSRSAVPHSAELRIDAEDGPIWIRADPAQVRQLVMNLITNAGDSLEDRGGTVCVTTGLRKIDPEALTHCFVLGRPECMEYACVEVSDDGCGMEREVMERIFDPFYSTKAEGRGLGLVSGSGIVRSQGAVLTVESVPGRGTTFRVLFPRAAAHGAVDGQAGDAVLDPAWTADGTVLVVDDEPAVARATAALVRKIGFQVVVANGGPQAVEILGTTGASVVAVVLDATMPSMDGEATFHALREMRSGIPVLFVSGHGSHEMSRLLESKQAVDFLAKPFSLAELRSHLGVVLKS
jgi:signal transduction histidine kinase/CheY-like chemotaxis protein